MSRFVFSFAQVEREIESLVKIAGSFLDPATHWVLADLKSQLHGIKSDRHRASFWGIALEKPLRTRPCQGGYQAGCRGRHDAYAEISATWTIRPQLADPDRLFEVTGNASSLIVLLEGSRSETVELGRFHIDMGAHGGPGAIFHVQIPEQPGTEAFPSTIDIPRFPIPPMTPLAVIEFILGELFQEAWQRRMSETSGSHAMWHTIQTRRLVNFFDWQLQLLCGRYATSSLSPLLALKRAAIEPNLFLDDFGRQFALNC